MSVVARETLYADSIIGSAAELVNAWRQDINPDLNEVRLPVETVIRDLLYFIGIPENGIAIVLGIQPVEDDVEPIHCALCEQPAVGLVRVRGGVRLACEEHIHEAEELGMEVKFTKPVKQ